MNSRMENSGWPPPIRQRTGEKAHPGDGWPRLRQCITPTLSLQKREIMRRGPVIHTEASLSDVKGYDRRRMTDRSSVWQRLSMGRMFEGPPRYLRTWNG